VDNPTTLPLFLVVCGEQATGKSRFARDLCLSRADSVLLTATDPLRQDYFANVFMISDSSRVADFLSQGEVDQFFHDNAQDFTLLIIDDGFDLSCVDWLNVDLRCRQLKTVLDKPFGGCSVIVTGDGEDFSFANESGELWNRLAGGSLQLCCSGPRMLTVTFEVDSLTDPWKCILSHTEHPCPASGCTHAHADTHTHPTHT